jgi:hypothetical protein
LWVKVSWRRGDKRKELLANAIITEAGQRAQPAPPLDSVAFTGCKIL